MSIEKEGFSAEKGGETEVQIGTGDPITVSSLQKIVYREKGAGPVGEPVPVEELQSVQESLAKLPFRIGEKEHISTRSRPAHEAAVVISPRSLRYDAPESEWKKRALIVRFEQGLQANLSFQNIKDLTFEQHEEPKSGKVNLIRFETDEVFEVGGEEIGEVRLVVPTEKPKS